MKKPLSEGEVSTGTGLRLELFVEDMEATTSFYTRVLPFALERHEAGNSPVYAQRAPSLV